jgi:hypothetical protein
MVVIVSKKDGDVFVRLDENGAIEVCIDKDGNKVVLNKQEMQFVSLKFKNGECDFEYSWSL